MCVLQFVIWLVDSLFIQFLKMFIGKAICQICFVLWLLNLLDLLSTLESVSKKEKMGKFVNEKCPLWLYEKCEKILALNRPFRILEKLVSVQMVKYITDASSLKIFYSTYYFMVKAYLSKQKRAWSTVTSYCLGVPLHFSFLTKLNTPI